VIVAFGASLLGLGMAKAEPVSATTSIATCSERAVYPKLGAPVNGRLSQFDMLNMSKYDKRVSEELLTCHARGSSPSQVRLAMADGYQYRVMSGALLYDAGQKQFGLVEMRAGVTSLEKLVLQASPPERARLVAYLLQAQKLYQDPSAQSVADQP